MVENRQQNPQGTGGTSIQDRTDWSSITNPTDFLNQFRQVCSQAKQHGVSEQQLLDAVNAGYSGGDTGTTGSSKR